ncbi:hypothetical protein [Desulfurococcus amylolyticus]|uniref:Uncharacterized protein n=1 Tax=Desulfurococcus amylolyticus DSM 16532 TaxID=768672 RepID=I3XRM4_DESAM|nr:hypothetical protein [Desulfurococcus amylolyticus]AFL66598.1 hypothetical protein Desfe_0699 [Desulfurococcus amylolyticus DSM 16532]
MSSGQGKTRAGRMGFQILIALGVSVLLLSLILMIQSIGYMEGAMVGASLLTALIGFSLLSASLYILRLAAYVYATDKRGESGEKEETGEK